jgi:large subunit ribosomal protein L31
MKQGIHPEYKDITFKCACGTEFVSRSTSKKGGVAICSGCHPFFTGKQKFVDTAGRVEKFMRKYQPKVETKEAEKTEKKTSKKK